MPRLEPAFVSWRRWRARAITKIRRIQIVLARDADQGEQGVAAGVGQRGAHALGVSGFSYGQTGQSEAIHSRRNGQALSSN